MRKMTNGAKIMNNAKVIVVFLFDLKYPTLNPSPKREGLTPPSLFGEGGQGGWGQAPQVVRN